MPSAAPDPIELLVDGELGQRIRARVRLGGGDVAESLRLELGDGHTVFAKTHRAPPPDFFLTEAAGLEWLRATGTVPVPEVLGVAADARVLEWIAEGRSSASTEAELGRGLAGLHRAPWPFFGRPDRRSTGSRRLPNEPADDWAEFYAGNRLLPLARLAADGGALPADAVVTLEVLAARLAELGVPAEPPSLLHGDLWAGNRLVGGGGRSWLIDPAAHGGHREFDLSMMLLFGGFGRDCFAAYDEVFPLADGFEDRVPLHQLAPLTVHAIKFGGGYGPATVRALEACMRL